MRATVIIYKSKYGTTKRYAQWLSEALDADLFAYGKISPEQVAKHDNIIIGGGVYAGKIAGLGMLEKNYELFSEKKLAVFAVGGNEATPENKKTLSAANLCGKLSSIPFFYFQGALDITKLHFPTKQIMQLILKKQSQNGQEAPQAFDFTNTEALAPLIEYFKK